MSIKVLVEFSYVLHRSQVCEDYTVLLILLPRRAYSGGTIELLKNICNTFWFISAYRPGEETVKIREVEDSGSRTILDSQAAPTNFRPSVSCRVHIPTHRDFSTASVARTAGASDFETSNQPPEHAIQRPIVDPTTTHFETSGSLL